MVGFHYILILNGILITCLIYFIIILFIVDLLLQKLSLDLDDSDQIDTSVTTLASTDNVHCSMLTSDSQTPDSVPVDKPSMLTDSGTGEQLESLNRSSSEPEIYLLTNLSDEQSLLRSRTGEC